MKRTTIILALPFTLLAGACDADEPEPELERSAVVDDSVDARPDGRAHGLLAKLDADGDGAISRAEAEGHFLAKKFDRLDTDGDGTLSADELAAMKKHGRKGMWKGEHGKRGKHGKHGKHGKDPQVFAERMLSKLDADGDGVLSRAEVESSRLAEKFASIDTDGDGKITLEELVAHKRAKHEAKRERHQADQELAAG
jgi:Ca2+-binding EF-hand superfamily protein